MTNVRRQLVSTAAALATIASLLLLRSALVTAPLDVLERSQQASASGPLEVFTGSWHFPRGGPYIVGTQCSDVCTLEIDGRVLSRRVGLAKTRRVYPPGIYSIKLTRRGSGRLLWHPPGRRGPPEYVPASSLSPDPPTTAQFDSSAGTSRIDGLIALAILATILAWLVALCFHGLRRIPLTVWIEVAAVFALALLVRLYGLGEAGPTWDEDVNWSAGRNYVTNLLSLDFADDSWIWNLEHPPVMKYLVGIGAQLTDGYSAARVISAVMNALACALLVPIARRLDLGSAGLFAGIAAALSPHLIAHGQIVGHESPSALWWAIGVLAALWASGRVARESTQFEWRLALVGAVVGLSIFSRFSNALLGPLVFVIVVARVPDTRRLEVAWKSAVIMPLAALAVGFLLWPRLWSSPIAHTQEAWQVLKKPHSSEPFLGSMTNRPPLYYFVLYLVATAPLGLLLAAVAGAIDLIRAHRAAALVILALLVVPLAIMASPVRQDGVRYIIPSLLALALLAGVGCRALGALLARRFGSPAHWSRAVAATLAAYLIVVCADIRPYYLDYYGEHVGGSEHVSDSRAFEIAWWGEGLDAALTYLNENAEPNARVFKGCVEPSHLAWMRTDLWASEVRSPKNADWVLAYNPRSRPCKVTSAHELVFEVTADGAPLARVYRRRQASSPATSRD